MEKLNNKVHLLRKIKHPLCRKSQRCLQVEREEEQKAFINISNHHSIKDEERNKVGNNLKTATDGISAKTTHKLKMKEDVEQHKSSSKRRATTKLVSSH